MGILGGAGGSSTGAPGGGPLGGLGMDFGLYKMPVIGSFFQDPNETFKQQQFHQMGQAYSAYRPEVAQARMNALNNRISAYQGANDVLSAMMGRPQATGSQLSRTPMGPSMMLQGSSKGADKLPDNSMFGSNGMLGGLFGSGIPGMDSGAGPLPGSPMSMGMGGGGMGGGLLGGGGLGGLFGGF